MADTRIRGIDFVSVYAEDYQKAYEFYSEVLGLTKAFDMGSAACFFSLNENMGLYLQGGCAHAQYGKETMRCSFTFSVDSASEFFNYLRGKGVKTIHDKPICMGEGMYWFMFFDPSGNILETLGKE